MTFTNSVGVCASHDRQGAMATARSGHASAWTFLAAALLASLALAATLGCSIGNSEKWKFASLDVRKAAFWKHDDKPDPETPERLATSWTEATLNRPGQPSQRGFGGRLAFFKQGSEDPVRVEGQLVVYAFDDSGADPYKTEPKRRYLFPAEQLALYESESALGPSYSVWIPWDETGGPEQKISLIARFLPKEGPVVIGEQTRHYLAGPPVSPIPADQRSILASAPTQAASQVTPASYQGAAPSSATSGNFTQASAGASLDTTTIALPRKLSPDAGMPLRSARTAAPVQMLPTPHMTGVSMSGSPTPAAATPEAVGPRAPVQINTPTGSSFGYLAPPGLPQASLPSVGYQSLPPQAPAQPTGR